MSDEKLKVVSGLPEEGNRDLLSAQVLDFFKQLSQLDGMGIGIHGTTLEHGLPNILNGGLNYGVNYYRLDSAVDEVIRRELSANDWQKLLGRLERTLTTAVSWGRNAFFNPSENTAVVVFIAEPIYKLGYKYPIPYLSDAGDPQLFPTKTLKIESTGRDNIAHFSIEHGESFEAFGKRAARTLITLRLTPHEINQHYIGERIARARKK